MDSPQVFLSNCHANGGPEALPEGTCGGFDTEFRGVFGMSCGLGTPLPELLDVLHGEWKS